MRALPVAGSTRPARSSRSTGKRLGRSWGPGSPGKTPAAVESPDCFRHWWAGRGPAVGDSSPLGPAEKRRTLVSTRTQRVWLLFVGHDQSLVLSKHDVPATPDRTRAAR